MPELADPTRQCVHMRFTEMPTVRLGWFILWNLRRVIYRRPHKRGLEQNCLPLAFTMAITPAATPAHSAEAINCCAPLPAERTTNRKNTSINVLVLPNKNARSSSYDSTETEGINSPGRKKILELFTKKKKNQMQDVSLFLMNYKVLHTTVQSRDKCTLLKRQGCHRKTSYHQSWCYR